MLLAGKLEPGEEVLDPHREGHQPTTSDTL